MERQSMLKSNVPDASPPLGRAPDAHVEVHGVDGCVLAECSLWWGGVPPINGMIAGMVGRYASTSSSAGREVLHRAMAVLTGHGCACAIGPIDGSTWGNYRWVTGGSAEPSFFLEPAHAASWPGEFIDSGFRPLARYQSTITDDLNGWEGKAEGAETRLKAGGVTVRALDMSRLEMEMRAIHAVTCRAFATAFLFQPIDAEVFLAAQAPLLPLVRPELVLMAERDGIPVGFVFAIPDLCQARRGADVETVIIKTVAVCPGRANAGLGVCLVRRLHRTARDLGFRRVIHALMHEGNNSLNIARSSTRLLREYALFVKEL